MVNKIIYYNGIILVTTFCSYTLLKCSTNYLPTIKPGHKRVKKLKVKLILTF